MPRNTSKPNGRKLEEKIAHLSLSDAKKHDLQKILANPVAYVPDERFRRATVMVAIMQRDINILPGSVLSLQEEHSLFMHLNYTRYKMGLIGRRLLKIAKWSENDALELLKLNQYQLNIRSKITSSNLRLVLAMAKHVKYYGVEFGDLVSEGNMALLGAIDLFDCSYGFKFSTYACKAILKSFSRVAQRFYRYRDFFPLQLDQAFEKSNHIDRLRQDRYHDQVHEVRNIIHNNLADLSEIELSVLQNRFPISEKNPISLTLKQVGERLDLSKERIRQIQIKAIAKLREIAEQRLVVV